MKFLWRLLLVGIVGGASVAAWQPWKRAHQNPLPEGIISGNGRIESVQVDVAAKYGGRIKEILAREGDLVDGGRSSPGWIPASRRPSWQKARRNSLRTGRRRLKSRPRSR